MNAHQLAKKAGMMSPEEVDLLQHCARQLPAYPSVINIGAGAGTSSTAILEVAPSAFIFSIDPKPVPDEAQAILSARQDNTRVVRVLGKSQYVGIHWPYPVDLCFVDGSHTDAAVLGDIVTWRPLVRPGGFMLFHDYHHPNLPTLSPIVDSEMSSWYRVGEARFLVAFRLVSTGEGLWKQ